jgi:hypothetical protein
MCGMARDQGTLMCPSKATISKKQVIYYCNKFVALHLVCTNLISYNSVLNYSTLLLMYEVWVRNNVKKTSLFAGKKRV